MNPQNGEAVEYPLPNEPISAGSSSTSAPVPPTFWTGRNHGAGIVKVEPLD
jgi:hypothetical protein